MLKSTRGRNAHGRQQGPGTARTRLRAFRLSALKSLTCPLRRRRVGIPKSKEDGGKKLKQIGQGAFSC